MYPINTYYYWGNWNILNYRFELFYLLLDNEYVGDLSQFLIIDKIPRLNEVTTADHFYTYNSQFQF